MNQNAFSISPCDGLAEQHVTVYYNLQYSRSHCCRLSFRACAHVSAVPEIYPDISKNIFKSANLFRWFLTLLSGQWWLYICISHLFNDGYLHVQHSHLRYGNINGEIAITLMHITATGHFSICHFLTWGNQRWFSLIQTHSIQCFCNKVKLDPQCYLMGAILSMMLLVTPAWSPPTKHYVMKRDRVSGLSTVSQIFNCFMSRCLSHQRGGVLGNFYEIDSVFMQMKCLI